MIDSCGRISSFRVNDKLPAVYADTQLGFEEYIARGYQIWGYNTYLASMFEPCEEIYIFDKLLLYDARGPRAQAGRNSIASLPYIYDGLEFGWDSLGTPGNLDYTYTDPRMRIQANTVYRVQELRHRNKGILTARTDHKLSKKPYFLYDAVFSNGYEWNTIARDGSYHPQLSLVSTQAVFGLWVLWETDYTDLLMNIVNNLYDEQKGWFEGRYEISGCYEQIITLSTNAMVLECLLYKKKGQIYRVDKSNSFYVSRLIDDFAQRPPCIPKGRHECNK